MSGLHPFKKDTNNVGTQFYYVLRKKAGITESNCILHISKTCFGKISNQAPLKEGLAGNQGKGENLRNSSSRQKEVEKGI